MGMPDHLTYLLRYAGQEASVRTRHGTSDWLQIGKGVHQAYCLCILPPCLLFNLFAEYIIRNAGKAMTNLDGIKKQRHHFANKGPYSQSYGFSSSHVWIWELYHKEGWMPKNWCFWTVVLEKTLESPLDCKKIKPVNHKGNQPWIFIGRIDAETEVPILWPPDAKSRLIGKDPDVGKDWRQEKGTTEDEMVGWHHWLNEHNLSKLQEMVKDREAWFAAVHGVTKNVIWLSNWTTRKERVGGHISIPYMSTQNLWWAMAEAV